MGEKDHAKQNIFKYYLNINSIDVVVC